MTSPPTNLAASVKQRLLNMSRAENKDFNAVLSQYATERFLYRLSQSPHAANLVLKGAVLFNNWSARAHRPTRDLDLLGFGEPTPESVSDKVRDICATSVEDDGLAFDSQSISAARIREDQTYEGVRVTLTAKLGKAKIDMQIEIGFGDTIVPQAQHAEFPTMLGFPAPTLRVYPRETVIAEKLQAMVVLGMANSRMKDFYDILILSREFEYSGMELSSAVAATFAQRRTPIPGNVPTALTDAFALDPLKAQQWTAFLRRTSLADAPEDFSVVAGILRSFLWPIVTALAGSAPFSQKWNRGGPWS